MSYKITGRIISLEDTQTLQSQKSGVIYTKRDMVINVRLFDRHTGEMSDETTNTPKFTFFGDKAAELDRFSINDIVTVSFDIYGRSYDKNGKIEYYTEVRPIKVELFNKPQINIQSLTSPNSAEAFPNASEPWVTPIQNKSADKLPF